MPNTQTDSLLTGLKLKFLRFWDSDLCWRFRHAPVIILSFVIAAGMILSAVFASWIAPYNPFDLASFDLANAFLPPAWEEGGSREFLLGTDDQGRDMLSAILYGLRVSLEIGLSSVFISVVLGISLGLLSGYVGGVTDAIIMRFCDVMLSFPAILLALLIDGVIRVVLPEGTHDEASYAVLIFAISLSGWVKYARTVRGSTLAEKKKEYVQAAQVFGVSSLRIMFTHILPNVLGPILVLVTVQIATAIITEATLSFLGVGVPPTTPSLGTLIRIGNEFLFSGEWWITIFPGLTLIVFVLTINLLGDWLRDALNPKLQGQS